MDPQEQIQDPPDSEVQRKIWNCMETCLTYNWQCLIYADKERGKMRLRAKTFSLIIMLIPFSLIILIGINIIARKEVIPYWIDICVALLSLILEFLKTIFLSEELHNSHMEDLDRMSNYYKKLYQKANDIYIEFMYDDQANDLAYNERINTVIEGQNEFQYLLNKRTHNLSKAAEKHIKQRVSEEMDAIFGKARQD